MRRMILMILCIGLIFCIVPGVSAEDLGRNAEVSATESSGQELTEQELLAAFELAKRQQIITVFCLAAIILAGFTIGSKLANKRMNKGYSHNGKKIQKK